MCNKNKELAKIEKMINNKEYSQAINKLDEILAKDADNKEAQLLKIRADMLLKKTQRNEEGKAPAPNLNNQPIETSQNPDSKLKRVAKSGTKGAGFSIMSFCQEKDTKNVTKITEKLSTN